MASKPPYEMDMEFAPNNIHNPKDEGNALHHTMGVHGFADFFSTEVFHLVLHNPTTAYRLQKFSQSHYCGENMEFLEKVCIHVYVGVCRLHDQSFNGNVWNTHMDWRNMDNS